MYLYIYIYNTYNNNNTIFRSAGSEKFEPTAPSLYIIYICYHVGRGLAAATAERESRELPEQQEPTTVDNKKKN